MLNVFMAIAVASISTYVYKYFIHRITILCIAKCNFSNNHGKTSLFVV